MHLLVVLCAVLLTIEVHGRWSFVSENNYCYFSENSRRYGYLRAKRRCAMLNATLPKITMPEPEKEYRFMIRKSLEKLRLQRPNLRWRDAFWMQYTDLKEEGKWVDDDGLPPPWANWYEGEPNSRGRQDCMNAVGSENWKWDDIQCYRRYHLICQKKVVCPDPDIANSILMQHSRTRKLWYRVRCKKGYGRRGPRLLKCQCNGTWDETATCVKQKIPKDYARQMKKLRKSVFKHYDKTQSPTLHLNKTTRINHVIFFPDFVEQVNVEQQKVILHGWISMIWKDERLQWSLTDYPDVYQITSKKTRVWRPPFWVINHVGGAKSQQSWWQKVDLRISFDGYVSSASKVALHLACPLDLKAFPFDVNTCQLPLSILMSKKTVDVERVVKVDSGYERETMVSKVSQNSPWKMRMLTSELKYTNDFHSFLEDKELSSYPEYTYPVASMTFEVKRNIGTRSVVIICCCLFTTVLALAGFQLKNDNLLCVYYTCLIIAETLTSALIYEALPSGDGGLPIICKYSAFVTGLTGFMFAMWFVLKYFEPKMTRTGTKLTLMNNSAISKVEEKVKSIIRKMSTLEPETKVEITAVKTDEQFMNIFDIFNLIVICAYSLGTIIIVSN